MWLMRNHRVFTKSDESSQAGRPRSGDFTVFGIFC